MTTSIGEEWGGLHSLTIILDWREWKFGFFRVAPVVSWDHLYFGALMFDVPRLVSEEELSYFT